MATGPEHMRSWKALARYAILLVAVSLLLIGAGVLPTMRLGGSDAVSAMLVGCGISLLAGLAGMMAMLVIIEGSGTAELRPADRLTATVVPMALRLGLVIAGGLAAGLSGHFDPRVLLIWLAISYCALLPVETAFAVRRLGAQRSEPS